MEQPQGYQDLLATMATIKDLEAASAVLGWDQETYMPEGAVAARADQLATLGMVAHQFMTSERTQQTIAAIPSYAEALDDRSRRVAATFARDVERATKLPSDLVEDGARTAALAQDAWRRARAASDFSIFQPLLERTVDLKLREIAILADGKAHPYDTLIDIYEPSMTVAQLTPVFERLQRGTTELLDRLRPVADRVDSSVLHRSYDGARQLSVARSIIGALGFQSDTGRVDLSSHPFCTSFSHTDVRLTTRIRENDLRSCLFGLIHEAGHGMYEQGIAPSLARTFSGTGASMGIHESQSLFWENVIARSEAFWHWAFPRLRDAFPDQLADQTPTSFYRAINRIEPSLNRVESDEVTYNLHIILRFEIERDLMDGSLRVADIPKRWNERMEQYLGVVPPNDAEGCLQDIHWSFGGIGYFPSYTLGKLYAAMEWKALTAVMPDASDKVANGTFEPILAWLRTNIHDGGRTETPVEILQRVTGRSLTEVDFMDAVVRKAEQVYGLNA